MSKLGLMPLMVIISFVSSKAVMINNGLKDTEQTNPKLIQGIDIPYIINHVLLIGKLFRDWTGKNHCKYFKKKLLQWLDFICTYL